MTEPALAPAPAADPRIGTVLADRYRIVRKLGEGGMGIVYEGVHTVIGRRLAIKMLHAQFATSADVVARFHREAVAATAIGHANIVEVIDMARAPDGAVFMVLEFLDGRDWAHDLEKTGAQSLGRVARILWTVCDALAAAHAKKIVHRDLKPENVFLVARPDEPDFVKIVDFGISKMLDAPESTNGKGLTQTGAAMGTPYYMAPEQMSGRKDIDHRADLYSVGVMLYQAVTGSYPFDGETIAMLALKVMSTDAPPLASHLAEVPEGLQAVIDRTLAKDPSQRYASAIELRDALAQWKDDARTLDAKPRVHADAPTLAAVEGATTPAIASTREIPGQRERASEPKSETKSETREPTPSAPSGARTGALLAVAAVVVLLAVFAVTRGEPEASVEPAPVAPPVASPPPEAHDDVHLVIVTTPADAELRLDGLVITNPFDGTFPRSREPHHLEARAPGHAPEDRELTLIADQRVALTLDPIAAGETTPAPVPASTPHHTPRTTHAPEVHAEAPPSEPVLVAPPPQPEREPTHDPLPPPSERLLKRPF